MADAGVGSAMDIADILIDGGRVARGLRGGFCRCPKAGAQFRQLVREGWAA